MKFHARYKVTVKTPYKSTRKIVLSEDTPLSLLAECILDSYGIVKDRAYFYFTGDSPWEGALYTDTAEFPKYLSAYSTPFKKLIEAGERFIFQIGYDPEFFFECTAEGSLFEGEPYPRVVFSEGGTVSEFLPAEEYGLEEGDIFSDEEFEISDEEFEYTEIELLVDKYLRSGVALYGVIPKKRMEEIILSFEPNLDLYDIRRAMRTLPPFGSRKDYVVDGREIVYTELFDMQSGEYFHLKKASRGKEWYLPSKEELLKYSDPLYFERTAEYVAVEDAVGADVAEKIYRMVAGGLSPEESLYVVGKISKTTSLREVDLELVKAMDLSVRRWELRGFSKKERG